MQNLLSEQNPACANMVLCALDEPAVSVLFTQKKSIYKSLGFDCWDKERDARNWPGGNPIVTHPPCRGWGQLAQFAKPEPGEMELSIWAIAQIRKWGGVLEHPRTSKLWPEYLPLPGTIDLYGGYSICVDQSWWGHKCKKNSLIYICGCPKSELPNVPIRFDAIEFTIDSRIKKYSGRRAKRILPKSQREATPIEFAKWLIEVAQKCQARNCA